VRKNGPVDQTRRNLLKTIRQNVRLAHSLAADNDLNVLLDKYNQQYQKDIQNGGNGATDLTEILEMVLEQVLVRVEVERKRTKALNA